MIDKDDVDNDDDNGDDVDDGKLIHFTSYIGRIFSIRTRRNDTI